MIELEAVSVRLRLRASACVDALTERVASGEWLGLIGPNGAGKSSVLRAIAGLLGPRGPHRGGRPADLRAAPAGPGPGSSPTSPSSPSSRPT